MHEALDGSRRRRIYLFRHGTVSYVNAEGQSVPNARLVELTPRGRTEASQMGEVFADVVIDRALCSGLPRTRQTGQLVLGDREIELEENLQLEEIAAGVPELDENFDFMRELAYAPGNAATDPEAQLLNGERFADAETRVVAVIEGLLAEDDWDDIAIFAHGGVNALLLGWALGMGRAALAKLEQDMCCLNVIDVDQDPETKEFRRAFVRAMNITAYDYTKHDIRLTAWESIASKFLGA
jgi:broad specificity phosphatase PhoE